MSQTKPKRSSRPVRRRVLVVDDDARHCEWLKGELISQGYDIETSADAKLAFELAGRRPPDAVVSKVVMPGIDGFTLCLAMRDDPLLSDIPVVLFSACEHGESLELAQLVGADAFVEREPDDVAAIRAALASLFARNSRAGSCRPAAAKRRRAASGRTTPPKA